MVLNCLKNILRFIVSLRYRNIAWAYIGGVCIDCDINKNSKIYSPFALKRVSVGHGTYISENARISETYIGKFCSIGPNFLSGWGIHPSHGLSTSPMFYSSLKQNGFTFSKIDKIEERKLIQIGNDVFIGANVTVLDGVTIGDGAIVAAGSVVIKDVPNFGMVGGVPAKLIKYRFTNEQIEKLIKIKWWNWEDKKLLDVESYFFEVEEFINKYY